MKNRHRALAAAGALLLLAQLAGCASSSMDEQTYIEAVRNIPSFPAADDAQVLELGQDMCGELSKQDGVEGRAAMVEQFLDGTDDTPREDRQKFVELSIQALCPEMTIA